jgi:hypothetical protein
MTIDRNSTPVKDLTHPPVLRLVAVEELNDYCESVASQATSIKGVYLVDAAAITHPCSLQGSYDYQYLYSNVESDLKGRLYEQLVDDVDEGGSESHPDHYQSHVPSIEATNCIGVNHLIDIDAVAEGQTYAEMIAEVKEYVICNWIF